MSIEQLVVVSTMTIYIIFLLPASQRYQLPMFIVLSHLCFDQISHELCKGRFWISFIPFPSSSKTNVPTVFSNELLLYPGVSLELVPVGGDNPGEGMPADHKGGRVLEPPQVGQATCPRPEFGTSEILIRDQGGDHIHTLCNR